MTQKALSLLVSLVVLAPVQVIDDIMLLSKQKLLQVLKPALGRGRGAVEE